MAARPPGDTRYSGKTGQGEQITLRVTSDRKGLQMRFVENLTCNRGPDKTAKAFLQDQRPTIKADGTFDYDKTYRDLKPVPALKETHTLRQRMTGSFTMSGRTVKGRIADTVTGRSGLTCKVVTRFTATRR